MKKKFLTSGPGNPTCNPLNARQVETSYQLHHLGSRKSDVDFNIHRKSYKRYIIKERNCTNSHDILCYIFSFNGIKECRWVGNVTVL